MIPSFVIVPANIVACCAIFLAARVLDMELPVNPAWYLLFDAKLEDIQELAVEVFDFYKFERRSFPVTVEEHGKWVDSGYTLSFDEKKVDVGISQESKSREDKRSNSSRTRSRERKRRRSRERTDYRERRYREDDKRRY